MTRFARSTCSSGGRRARSPRVRAALALLLAGVLACPYARAQAPAQVGAWDPPFALPLIAIHSAVLPTGKVLFFSAEHGVPGIHGWLLDPVSLALVEVPPPAPWNPDCSGHSFLPDGRLLVAGGTLAFSPLTGSRKTYTFDPYAEQWVEVADMAGGRWYPTNITLGDGTVITMAGLGEMPGTDNDDIELFDPNGSNNWVLLGARSLPYYPLLHLLPGGLVFRSGPDPVTETYDPATDTWTPVATTNATGRYEGTSVLLPPTQERVMLIGGYAGSGPPTSSAEVIDLSQGTPQWSGAAHMSFARMELDAVLLPDGTVFVVGGRSNATGPDVPVLTPEVYDPGQDAWTSVAAHLVPRMYHSSAVLLPDGRVLAAGGDYEASGEIYSPAYLFQGARPGIASAPAAIAYGTTFGLQFSGTTATHTVVLMRTSCVTHSNNMSQRHVSLGAVGSGGAGSVGAPTDPDRAPPGFYMLFVVDENGLPSASAMVRVITRFGDMDQDGDVDALDHAAFSSCFTGPGAGPIGPGCEPADFDGDGDVDCSDWTRFQLAWTAPAVPPSLPQCPTVYCSAKLNSIGCLPEIGSSGVPSATAIGSFDVAATLMVNNKSGLFFYGLNGQKSVPFQGGTMCVEGPRQRTPVQDSGGNSPPDDCSGSYVFDFNALVQGGAKPGLAPGVQVNGQYWGRDPLSPSTTALTDAIEFTIQP